jgi:hypothetical protein
MFLGVRNRTVLPSSSVLLLSFLKPADGMSEALVNCL